MKFLQKFQFFVLKSITHLFILDTLFLLKIQTCLLLIGVRGYIAKSQSKEIEEILEQGPAIILFFD